MIAIVKDSVNIKFYENMRLIFSPSTYKTKQMMKYDEIDKNTRIILPNFYFCRLSFICPQNFNQDRPFLTSDSLYQRQIKKIHFLT